MVSTAVFMLSQTQFQGDYGVGKGILLMAKNLEPRGQPLELRREERSGEGGRRNSFIKAFSHGYQLSSAS